MRNFARIALLPLVAPALAACGGAGEEKAKAPAASEVVEGSISDAMLPLDSVRSQPPLAPRVERTGPAGAKRGVDEGGEGTEAGDDAADTAGADAAPPSAKADTPPAAAATRGAE